MLSNLERSRQGRRERLGFDRGREEMRCLIRWSGRLGARSDCVAAVRAQTRDRNQHYADTAARRARILTITAWLAVVVSVSFVLVQIVTGTWTWQITTINVCAAMIFAIVPWLQRFGELVAPLTFIGAAYVSIFATCWDVGHRFGRAVLLPGRRLSGRADAGDRTHRPGVCAGGCRRRPGHRDWSSWSRATPGCSRPGPVDGLRHHGHLRLS